TAPANAQLVDRKTYAGSTCAAVNSANQAFFAIQGGAAVNTSDSPLAVSCPVIMDNTSGTGKGISNASVVVVNPNPNAAVTCSLQSRDVTGKVQGFRNASSDSFKGAKGFGTITIITANDPPLAAGNTPVVGGFVPGVYTLTCTIPPAALVNGSKA